MKQTSVEWLVSILNKEGFTSVLTDEEIEQAKTMEKQQIIDAYRDGGQDILYSKARCERYYNETYKSE